MGFNLGGLVIDRNYHNNTEQLEEILGKQLFFEKEVDYSLASENFKDDEYCDVYYTSMGTLVFLSMEEAGGIFPVAKHKTVSFTISQTTMTYCLNYTRNKFLVRSVLEAEGELLENKGDELDFEETESDKAELIYYLIEDLLGQNFWDIDDGAVCYRYTFAPLDVKKPSETIESFTENTEPINEKPKVEEKSNFFGKVLKGLGIK